VRQERLAAKEAARIAAEEAEKARQQALLNDEAYQLELQRQARKERKLNQKPTPRPSAKPAARCARVARASTPAELLKARLTRRASEPALTGGLFRAPQGSRFSLTLISSLA
jgi:hypothetical protein